MANILLSGLINIETTLKVPTFPIDYTPVEYPFFGIRSTVSGVGFNIAKALRTLGNEVVFLSLIGQDDAAPLVRESLQANQISGQYIYSNLAETPRSIIIYDETGKRQIHVDLKDIQDQVYPEKDFEHTARECDLLILCNINFSRPFLHLAHKGGKIVATDVHAVKVLEDPYNREFMRAADILFMSDELLPIAPEAWAEQVMAHYGPQILVIGLGEAGALLAVREDGFLGRYPAVKTRRVVNTIGAGDALFSAFIHTYSRTKNPYESLKRAIVFASYKIGAAGAADGFIDHAQLERLYLELFSQT
jgi:ribokinase